MNEYMKLKIIDDNYLVLIELKSVNRGKTPVMKAIIRISPWLLQVNFSTSECKT